MRTDLLRALAEAPGPPGREDRVRALNAVGSTPRDIIAILQSLHAEHVNEVKDEE